MSENGESQDLNPGQAFHSSDSQNVPVTSSENPNEYFKNSERVVEPRTIRFGDLITFENIENDQVKDVKQSVIIDVRKDADFMASRLEKSADGKNIINPSSFSTHGVERPFFRYKEQLTKEQIEEAMDNYFNNELALNAPQKGDDEETAKLKARKLIMLPKLRDRNLGYLKQWSENQERNITIDNIRAGRNKKK